ncbi:MAG: DUF4097 domain-containing protein [Candidatus Aminicenantes bacterium]|nr:DUF4097 domain-containing protein [Candidatus Aminicenantes bacterium]
MKHVKLFGQKTLLLVVMFSILFLNVYAGDKKEVDKTFKPKELVKIKIVSGDCIIKAGSASEIKVHMSYTYSPDKFQPVFEEEGNTLILKEDFQKGEHTGGESKWDVTVPANTKIEFAAASGDLEVSGVKAGVEAKVASGDITADNLGGGINVKSASGDITITDSTGDIKMDTASGDAKLTKVSGSFNIKTASGEIEADGIECKSESNFTVVSGDLTMKLAKSSDVNMNLATVSGDITLDYNGNPVKGYFTFKGQKDNISSDIPFDGSDESKHNPFATKYFKKGESPQINLKTVSGDIKFKK